MSQQDEIRVRIAPSPTGDPHVGTAYIALFNYVLAKQKPAGKFVLRIEDTDQTRSTKSSEDAIIRALKWLDLDWDEGPDIGGPYGPYRQSERTQIYQEHAQILLEKGAAYRCFCPKERLDALRKEQIEQKKSFRGYDGLCRSLSKEDSATRAKEEKHVIRLAMPKEGKTIVHDQLRKPLEIENAETDDQVLLKADGFPTYHLANVVDDHLMKITHVVRAEEWLKSTPKHVCLYQAFGWKEPIWIHMPLLRNNDKNRSKISKRKNPVSLDYYRDTGILSKALRNFLGLMGWAISGDREKFTIEEMIEVFEIKQIHLGGPVFDLVKLKALNALYIRDFSEKELLDHLLEWRLSKEFFAKTIPLIQQRIDTLSDFIPLTEYFFSGDLHPSFWDNAKLPKGRSNSEIAKILVKYVELLDTLGEFTVEKLEKNTREFCEENEWKPKELFMLIRLGVTGRTATPPLFDTMTVLGRELTRRRLRLAAEYIKQKK